MGTTSEKLVYLNETKQKIKESINLTNANIVDEPFRQYAVILKNRLPEIVGDPSIIWNNYEHVTGSGTSITISTYKSIFEYSLNGDTTQSGTPTPDAPIPINTVTGNQTITISNGTDSTVQYINLGKNLLNENNYINSVTTNGITYTNNGDGTFNFVGTATAGTTFILLSKVDGIKTNTNYYLYSSQPYNNNTYNISVRLTTGSGNYEYITPQNIKKTPNVIQATRFSIYFASGTQVNIQNAKAMLIRSDAIDISYAPYFEPIELCKIGTYQDRIYKSNGKWYLHKEIGKVVLNGSEGGWFSEGGQAPFAINLNIFRNNYVSTLICNYFKNSYWNDSWSSYTSLVSPNSTSTAQPRIKFRYTSITSLDDFKTWLGTHNTIVYYVLDTATTEEIKDYDLLNDLNSLELMTGNINITVSGDLPSPIDITAIKN